MLISRSTEYLGIYLETDYALLAIPVVVKGLKTFSSFPSIQPKLQPDFDQERAEFEFALKQKQIEIEDLQKAQITQEKFIKDAER